MKVQQVIVLAALAVTVGACSKTDRGTTTTTTTKTTSDQSSASAIQTSTVVPVRHATNVVKTSKVVKSEKKVTHTTLASKAKSKLGPLHRNPATAGGPQTPAEDSASGMTSGSGMQDTDTTGALKTYEKSGATGRNL